MSEREFQSWVIDVARGLGWRVAHFRPAMTQRGNWITPVQADGKGFPDLVLVRRDRLIFAELKAEKGRLSKDQQEWLKALYHVENEMRGIAVYVWKPSDRDEIERILR